MIFSIQIANKGDTLKISKIKRIKFRELANFYHSLYKYMQWKGLIGCDPWI